MTSLKGRSGPSTLAGIATKLALVGPGAVGTTIAALLYQAGHEVLVCGHRPRERLELRPDGADTIIVPGPVHTDPATVTGPVDFLVLAVKSTQNTAASGWLAHLCGEHTLVAVLQNGVEQVEHVRPLCPSPLVIPASVWFSAETQPQGWVRLRGQPVMAVPDSAAARQFADLLIGAGCKVDCHDDFVTVNWRKLLLNALAGFMALSGRRSGMFRRDDVADLARRYVAECVAVARAEGAQLGDDTVELMVDSFRAAPEDMGTSILADRVADRPMEWDVRNAVIIRKARAHGLPTPISDVLVPLLAAASEGPG